MARSGRLLVVWGSGLGRRCTFFLGCWQGWWCGSNGFPARGTPGDRMNVQRGRRRTFIPSPGARAVWRIRVILAFTDRGL